MRAGVYGRQSKGNAKSIDEQITEGHQVVADQGWQLAGTYSDAVSASRYGTAVRGGWAEVRAAITAGQVDVLVLWEASRGDRKPAEWLKFLDECRGAGVRVYVISEERLFDLSKPGQYKELASAGVQSGYESDMLSVRIRRGVAGAAKAGRPPAGPPPYGYRRVYDPATGALVGQEPDPEQAAVVVWIYAQVAHHVPFAELLRQLAARGIAPPRGAVWYRMRLRDICTNRTYLGLRKHRDAWHPAPWPALVDEATWYAVQRVLTQPARLAKARPGRQVHLLTYLATCARCGSELHARAQNGRGQYVCKQGCLMVQREPTDRLITDLVLARLADPAVYLALKQAGADRDAVVAAAHAQVAVLTGRLEEWRASAARGVTTPESLAAIEAGITAELTAAQAVVDAGVPAALEGWLGGASADVAARWAAAPVQGRRAVLRALGLRVAVRPVGQRSGVPVHERIDVSWR